MQRVIDEAKKDCEAGFGEDKAAADACTAKVVIRSSLYLLFP